MALSYFLNRKRTLCVISLSGSISQNDLPILDRCLKEAKAEPASYYILNLGGLQEIAQESLRPVTNFQGELRALSKLLLCNVPPELAKSLGAKGLIRESEVRLDLMACLEAITSEESAE